MQIVDENVNIKRLVEANHGRPVPHFAEPAMGFTAGPFAYEVLQYHGVSLDQWVEAHCEAAATPGAVWRNATRLYPLVLQWLQGLAGLHSLVSALLLGSRSRASLGSGCMDCWEGA